jgi:integrase/recombinase XerC
MYLEGFYTYLQFEKRYSKNTLEAYSKDISQFQDFLIQEYQSDDPELLLVNHRQVRAWVIHLMNNNVTPKSVNRKISALKTYYRFLLKNNAIAKNPMAKVVSPKIPKKLPLFVEKTGMEELFDVLDQVYPVETEVQRFVKQRDRLIVELLYSTGMRRAELLGLADNSFDRAQQQVKVLGKGNKERIIPVSKGLMLMADDYIAERKRIFGAGGPFIVTESGKPAYPKMIYNIVHQVLNHVTTLTRKSPHVLRHTFATHLSNNGAELNAIKELLGHASLASTQVYTHNTIDQLKKIHKLAHPKG